MYRILLSNISEKFLEKLPEAAFRRLDYAIESLKTNPRPTGCVKLTNEPNYRIRVGEFRIIYSVNDNILTVHLIKVGYRKDVYRKR